MQALFCQLSETWKRLNSNSIYVIDSFPVATCDNYRIQRCQIYQDEAFRGRQASKKRYYYGLKIHLMTTETGQPVEFFLTPGSIGSLIEQLLPKHIHAVSAIFFY
jgi:hypothetical protein